MIRPYRCYNCGVYPDTYDFYAEDVGKMVACPKCKITVGEFKDHLTPLVLIHFDPPHPVVAVGRGTRRRACAPAVPTTNVEATEGEKHGATGVAMHVTCPNCRKSVEYAAAIKAYPPENVWRTYDEKQAWIADVKAKQAAIAAGPAAVAAPAPNKITPVTVADIQAEEAKLAADVAALEHHESSPAPAPEHHEEPAPAPAAHSI
jgi:hypothetical protein